MSVKGNQGPFPFDEEENSASYPLRLVTDIKLL